MSKNYDSLYENSLGGSKTTANRKRKKIKITNYKKFARALLISALVLVLGGKGISIIADKISRDRALDSANEYMRTKIVTYLEKSDLDYGVLEEKIIFENDQDKLKNFMDLLINDGFSRDEVFYMVSQVCDKKEFDNIVKTSGWENADAFLRERYFSGEASSSGETLLGKHGDYNKFENNVEIPYVESVNDLIEMEENKGVKR